jgi:hypothetical protein
MSKRNESSDETGFDSEKGRNEAHPDPDLSNSKLLDIDLMLAELKVITKMAVPVSLTGSLQVLVLKQQ